jgi:hypothetical protein
MTFLRWVPAVLLVLPWLFGSAVPPSEVRIRDATATVSFRLLDWETVHLAERASRLWAGLVGPDTAVDQDAQTLRAYFQPGTNRTPARPGAEAALERAVAQAYQERGIPRSAPISSERLFPPVLVALTPPPNVLIVAPRSQLRVMSSVVLSALDTGAQERVEASADSTGVSSLVAPIGGLATYPSMVLEEDSAERVLAAVAHEWLHQYLIFYPLGAGYWDKQETREINETTADLVGQEIGAEVAARYDLRRAAPPAARPAGFDFRAFMRETRLRTEQLLAAGQVDEAEAYMRARRDELVPHGYTIRKLNQAYFALYGSYGGGFAASPANPIPDLLRELRARSGSLAEFVFQVRGITSVADLTCAARATPPCPRTTPTTR